MSDATPAPAPAADPAAPAPAPAAPWHGVTDPDVASYVDNKGWKTPADVITGYRNAEKLIGRDPNTLITVPRPDDPDGFRAVMQKLGLPESPDKYEFAKPPEGITPDEGYQTWAKQTFHELGLPAQTVKALTAKHNEYVKGVLDQQAKDYDLRVQADKQALLDEWRGGHERMLNAAKTAAQNLGLPQAAIDAIERTLGYKETMKLFAGIGTKIGEDSFVTPGDKKGGFGDNLTPAEAKNQWEEFKADPVNAKALTDPSHPKHKLAKETQSRLFRIMYPG